MHTCIIIDDEPLAIDVLLSYARQSELLRVLQTFTGATDAFSFLQTNEVDLVFLDINMPKMTGLELIRSLVHKPKFIITSAYREYAYEGYELDVADYLMKPIPYDRFLKSIAKAGGLAGITPPKTATPARFIFVRESRKMTKILLDDILYLESQKDYVHIYTTGNSRYITRGTLSYYEDWLSGTEFVRVHRSFLVAIAKIRSFTEEEVEMAGGKVIPIGDLYPKGVQGRGADIMI